MCQIQSNVFDTSKANTMETLGLKLKKNPSSEMDVFTLLYNIVHGIGNNNWNGKVDRSISNLVTHIVSIYNMLRDKKRVEGCCFNIHVTDAVFKISTYTNIENILLDCDVKELVKSDLFKQEFNAFVDCCARKIATESTSTSTLNIVSKYTEDEYIHVSIIINIPLSFPAPIVKQEEIIQTVVPSIDDFPSLGSGVIKQKRVVPMITSDKSKWVNTARR